MRTLVIICLLMFSLVVVAAERRRIDFDSWVDKYGRRVYLREAGFGGVRRQEVEFVVSNVQSMRVGVGDFVVLDDLYYKVVRIVTSKSKSRVKTNTLVSDVVVGGGTGGYVEIELAGYNFASHDNAGLIWLNVHNSFLHAISRSRYDLVVVYRPTAIDAAGGIRFEWSTESWIKVRKPRDAYPLAASSDKKENDNIRGSLVLRIGEEYQFGRSAWFVLDSVVDPLGDGNFWVALRCVPSKENPEGCPHRK